MRLSREAWQQIEPIFAGRLDVEFDYRGRHRIGFVDSIGEGPAGAFLTLCHPDGVFKSYSLSKIENLRVGKASATHSSPA